MKSCADTYIKKNLVRPHIKKRMTTYLCQTLHFGGLLGGEISLELHIVLEQLLVKGLDDLILSKARVWRLLVD